MVIISLEHAEPKIEGYLQRHMLKIRPGIFGGRLSKARRDLLWQHIIKEQPDIDAVMCYDAASNSIGIETHGSPTRHVIDVDGINLLAFPRPEPWKDLFAKPDKLLWEHAVETAAMAQTFLTESNYKLCLNLLYEQVDDEITKQQFLNSILFLIALHDLGKLHPYFQQNLQSKPAATDVRYGFRHEHESWRQLLRYLKDHMPDTGDKKTIRMLTNAIKDHHQAKSKSPFEEEAKREVDSSEAYKNSVQDMISFVSGLYPFTYFTIAGKRNLFCQLLSGILRFSDWAASSYCNALDSKSENYTKKCNKLAKEFLQAGGLMEPFIEDDKEWTYKNLCDLNDDTLYPLQKRLITVLKEHPKAECILIEDQPGSGKTEGAFYAALQLMKSHGCAGLYVALPTDATASEMLPRLKRCFQEHGLFSTVNAGLLTGKAWLYDEIGSDTSEENNERIDWEKKSRKLFMPFACGTVDQLMQAGIKLKAGDMRLLALSNKVEIIDEFHAYDAYMMNPISSDLKWLRAMNVPVIILSATLLNKTRKELFSIYSDESPQESGYPRITCAEEGHVTTYICEAAREKTYKVETIKQEDAIAKVLDSVNTGGNTLYIANTVKKAWEMYQAISKAASENVVVRLYTARTTPENKEQLGKEFVFSYGKEGKKAGKRPSGTIVISTQIMEMSVDVDFDTVFSELAPADALFQRMGRMARHDDAGTVREKGFESIFYLVISEKQNGWARPYVESVLEGTERVFSCYTEVNMPGDVQTMLEESYKEAGEKWEEEARRLAAHGTNITIKDPDSDYEIVSDFMNIRNGITRFQAYETETLICLPEGEMIDDTITWARKAVLAYSVTVPKYITDKLSAIHDTSNTKWLKDYKIVRDEECFWGQDKQFVYGL